MHIEFTFKNFEYARRRFEKTGRFLGKSPALDLQVVLAVDKHRHRAEIKLTGEGLNITASEQSDDMYATIDLVTDKIESQVRKAAAKAHQSRRKSTYDVQEENGTKVVNGTENYSPKPLHLDEALLQLEQTDGEVLVFFHADLERINVLYRKRNGDFGLIAPLS